MPEAPILKPGHRVVDDLPGFPHPVVTLKPLTVGGFLRLQKVPMADPTFPLHLVAECMDPRMEAADLAALPVPQMGNVNRLIAACTELSSALFRPAEGAADPPD